MAKNKKYIRWHQNNYLYIAIKFYAIKSYYVCVFIATFEKGTKILDLLFNLSLKVKKNTEATWSCVDGLHAASCDSEYKHN